jgi:hypothetical protein
VAMLFELGDLPGSADPRYDAAMTERKTYQGSCHCGKVRYEVSMELSTAMECNCSNCSRLGYLLTFVPEGQFKLLQGADDLADYTFNRHSIHHVFCKTCGVHSFARGSDGKGNAMSAINVRCLDGVDVSTLELKKVDGRSF